MAANPLIAATAAKAQDALKRRKVRYVHVGLFDHDGAFRERRLPLDLAKLAFDGKLEWCNNVRGWDSADAMWDPRSVVGEPVRIDPTSGRDYGFEVDAALYVADYIGVSVEVSPRNLLARQIAKADAMGYAVKAAFECELFILDETADSLREKKFTNLDFFATDNRCWDAMPAAEHAGFLADLDAAERLLASKSARALYGDAFVEQFGNSRLNEYTVCSRQVGAFERGRYMDVV